MICLNLECSQIPDKYKLFKKRSTSRLRLTFYTERIVNMLNHLPSDVHNFNTLSAFERTIKLVEFADYLKCFYIVSSLATILG